MRESSRRKKKKEAKLQAAAKARMEDAAQSYGGVEPATALTAKYGPMVSAGTDQGKPGAVPKGVAPKAPSAPRPVKPTNAAVPTASDAAAVAAKSRSNASANAAVKPRPVAPPPAKAPGALGATGAAAVGSAGAARGARNGNLPKAPDPIVTPNLWGPDSELAKHQNVVEEDLQDPTRLEETNEHQRKRIAIYIVCAAVVIVVATLVAIFGAGDLSVPDALPSGM